MNFLCKRAIIILNTKRLVHNSAGSKEKWDLLTAVCLERKPIITPTLTDLEQKYKKLLEELEFEKSLKSDHELRHENDLKQQDILKKGDGDIDVMVKETAQDFLDASTDELTKFKFPNRITEADESKNVKSLSRKLDKHLVLVVKQKIDKDTLYMLPQSLRQDGETLRQTAERILFETCGKSVKAQFYSNAPSGFYKYKYPLKVQKESNSVGAKIFIYFARHRTGELQSENLDFKWLDRNELDKELNKNYYHSVKQFLIDE